MRLAISATVLSAWSTIPSTSLTPVHTSSSTTEKVRQRPSYPLTEPSPPAILAPAIVHSVSQKGARVMHMTGIFLGRITLPLVATAMLLVTSLPAAQAADAFKMGVVDPQQVL